MKDFANKEPFTPKPSPPFNKVNQSVKKEADQVNAFQTAKKFNEFGWGNEDQKAIGMSQLAAGENSSPKPFPPTLPEIEPEQWEYDFWIYIGSQRKQETEASQRCSKIYGEDEVGEIQIRLGIGGVFSNDREKVRRIWHLRHHH